MVAKPLAPAQAMRSNTCADVTQPCRLGPTLGLNHKPGKKPWVRGCRIPGYTPLYGLYRYVRRMVYERFGDLKNSKDFDHSALM